MRAGGRAFAAEIPNNEHHNPTASQPLEQLWLSQGRLILGPECA
jgi:hypothetical protein